VLALTLVIAGAAQLSAHRRDEYLQAARIAIDPDAVQIELDLTPGIALAEDIIADVDRNRDGTLSPEEQRAYGILALAALAVEVDGKPLRVQLSACTFPDNDAFRHGEGSIQLQSTATLPRLNAGAHQLRFRNQHHPDRSVYLANALVPRSYQVAVVGQRRDPDQRELTIDYIVRAGPGRATTVWLLSSLAIAAALSAAVLFRASRSLR
jgi:hypothetical protein